MNNQSLIQKDLYRYMGKVGLKAFLFAFFRIPGFRFMFFWRKAKHSSKYNPLKYIHLLCYIHFSYKYGFQIPLPTQIDEGFYIGHFGAIVVNRHTVIGRNCNISHGVTIGQENRGARAGAPTIGDRVWIGTGTVLVGKISVGNNVMIAPNSYVNFDIPDNSLVIGNPGQIFPKTESVIDKYIENMV